MKRVVKELFFITNISKGLRSLKDWQSTEAECIQLLEEKTQKIAAAGLQL